MFKKKFAKSVVVSCLVLVIPWISGSFAVKFLAPVLVFDVQESHDYNYGVKGKQVFIADKYGDELEMLIVQGEKKFPLLYFHGNDGRIGYILQDAKKAFTLYSPAYPGFSQSTGNPSEEGVYQTVDAAMNYLFDLGYMEEEITILGHSLGGSAAIYAAIRYPDLKEVIIVNTFYSMQEMCESRFYIFCTLTGDIFNTAAIAPGAEAKIRQYHNPNDELIPFEQGQKLFEILGSDDKKFFEITGTHRNFDVDLIVGGEI